MRNLCLKISLFDLVIRKGYLTINVLRISLIEGTYVFRLLGIEIHKYTIYLQILGIPIIIPLNSKVR